MSVKPEIETKSTPLDTLMLLVSIAIMIGGIVAFYYFEAWPEWQRWAAVLGGLFVGALLAVQTHPGKSVWHFVQGSRIEVRKMVWPSKRETNQTTLMIIVVVIILGVIMWGMDAVLLMGTKFLTGQGG